MATGRRVLLAVALLTALAGTALRTPLGAAIEAVSVPVPGSTEEASGSAFNWFTFLGPGVPAFGLGTESASANGRFVAFATTSPNLIPGQRDDNGTYDIFLLDTATGETILVSHAHGSFTRTASGSSANQVISADGEWLAFESDAPDLVPGQQDPVGTVDVFLFHRRSRAVVLVSSQAGATVTAANRGALYPAISAGGEFVGFLSYSTDLVAGQVAQPLTGDVFVFDRSLGVVHLVTKEPSSVATESGVNCFRLKMDSSGELFMCEMESESLLLDRLQETTESFQDYQPAMSGDGRYVAYQGLDGLHLRDRLTATDVVIWAGTSESHIMSFDGSAVAFTDSAPDVDGVPTDAVYVYDRLSQASTLASRVPGYTDRTGRSGSFAPSISANGARVVFASNADDLVSGLAVHGTPHAFMFDRGSGTVVLVDRVPDSDADTANRGLAFLSPPLIAPDGRFATFRTFATDLADGDRPQLVDTYLAEFGGGLRLLSEPPLPASPSTTASDGAFLDLLSPGPMVSDDGRWVLFRSGSRDLVEGFAGDPSQGGLFLRDRLAATTQLVNRVAGTQATVAEGEASIPVLSADGRYSAFLSGATDLVLGQVDNNGGWDVFLYDQVTGAALVVSRAASSPTTTGDEGAQWRPGLSADGRFTAFCSGSSNLLPGPPEPFADEDVFLFDRVLGTVELVSRRAGTGGEAVGGCWQVLSRDGRFVGFVSSASDLVAGQIDGVGFEQAFLFDRITGENVLVSHTAGAPAQESNGSSHVRAVSAGGEVVLFSSTATDLVAGQVDSAGSQDLFLFDRASGGIQLVSHQDGDPAVAVGQGSTSFFPFSASIAMDDAGSRVVFVTVAGNVAAGVADGNGVEDVFLFERATGLNALVSGSAQGGSTANAPSGAPAISAGGSRIAFASFATDLVSNQADHNASLDVFLHEPASNRTTLITHRAGSAVEAARSSTSLNGLTQPAVSANGSVIVFGSNSPELVSSDFNEAFDVFAYDSAIPELLAAPSTRLTTSEVGSGVGFDLFLSAAPAQDVLVALQGTDPSEGQVAQSALTFTTSNWSTPQSVTISPVDDDLADGDVLWEVRAITNVPVGVRSLEVLNLDNEAPGTMAWPGSFYSLPPCRMVDTRNGGNDGGALVPTSPRILVLTGRCGVPPTAKALAVIVTAVAPTAGGSLQLYRADLLATPNAAALSFNAGQTRSGNAVIGLPFEGGAVALAVAMAGGESTHVLVDVAGYFE